MLSHWVPVGLGCLFVGQSLTDGGLEGHKCLLSLMVRVGVRLGASFSDRILVLWSIGGLISAS